MELSGATGPLATTTRGLHNILISLLSISSLYTPPPCATPNTRRYTACLTSHRYSKTSCHIFKTRRGFSSSWGRSRVWLYPAGGLGLPSLRKGPGFGSDSNRRADSTGGGGGFVRFVLLFHPSVEATNHHVTTSFTIFFYLQTTVLRRLRFLVRVGYLVCARALQTRLKERDQGIQGKNALFTYVAVFCS